jgi:hypothetical protein
VALEHNSESVQDLEQLGVEKDHIHAACRMTASCTALRASPTPNSASC